MGELLTALVTSPWVYVIAWLLCTLDGFFPVFPSESVLIALGVFAADGSPELTLLIAAGALGGFTGDNVAYQRRAGPTMSRRLGRRRRGRAALRRARGALDRRGGMLIVVTRYVPGGRTATTVTAGTLGYPRWRFQAFAALAAVTWTYSCLLGFWGGQVFEDSTLRALLAAFVVAGAITAGTELIRWLRGRRSGRERGPGSSTPSTRVT